MFREDEELRERARALIELITQKDHAWEIAPSFSHQRNRARMLYAMVYELHGEDWSREDLLRLGEAMRVELLSRKPPLILTGDPIEAGDIVFEEMWAVYQSLTRYGDKRAEAKDPPPFPGYENPLAEVSFETGGWESSAANEESSEEFIQAQVNLASVRLRYAIGLHAKMMPGQAEGIARSQFAAFLQLEAQRNPSWTEDEMLRFAKLLQENLREHDIETGSSMLTRDDMDFKDAAVYLGQPPAASEETIESMPQRIEKVAPGTLPNREERARNYAQDAVMLGRVHPSYGEAYNCAALAAHVYGAETALGHNAEDRYYCFAGAFTGVITHKLPGGERIGLGPVLNRQAFEAMAKNHIALQQKAQDMASALLNDRRWQDAAKEQPAANRLDLVASAIDGDRSLSAEQHLALARLLRDTIDLRHKDEIPWGEEIGPHLIQAVRNGLGIDRAPPSAANSQRTA